MKCISCINLKLWYDIQLIPLENLEKCKRYISPMRDELYVPHQQAVELPGSYILHRKAFKEHSLRPTSITKLLQQLKYWPVCGYAGVRTFLKYIQRQTS
jgi:hypothetical protein